MEQGAACPETSCLTTSVASFKGVISGSWEGPQAANRRSFPTTKVVFSIRSPPGKAPLTLLKFRFPKGQTAGSSYF